MYTRDHVSRCSINHVYLSSHHQTGCSACKVTLFAVSFTCHVSGLNRPHPPPPPPPRLHPLAPALCSSGCFSKLSLAQDPVMKTQKILGGEGKREQQEMACHMEAKQTQISAVYLRSPRLIFIVVLGAVVISLAGVRGRSLHFPWNLCLAKHWKLQRRCDDIWTP